MVDMRLNCSYYQPLLGEHQLRNRGRMWRTVTINKEDQNPVKLSPPVPVSSPQLYYPISSVFLPSLPSASLPPSASSLVSWVYVNSEGFHRCWRHLRGSYLSLAAGEGSRRSGSDCRPCTTWNPMPADDAMKGQMTLSLPVSLPVTLTLSLPPSSWTWTNCWCNTWA